MTSRIIWKFAVLGIIAVLVLVAAWKLLPEVVDRLPTDIRGRIPEEVLSSIMTPIPTALPLPLATVQNEIEFVIGTGTPVEITLPTRRPSPIPAAPIAPTGTAEQTAAIVTRPSSTPTVETVRLLVPNQAELHGLEVKPQKYNNCGPANLSMVLHHQGVDIDQLEIAAELRPHSDDRNVSPYELADYVNNNSDLQAAVFVGGDRFVLKRLISQGYPVIIEKGLVPSDWQGWMGHYLTLYGYDDQQQAYKAMDTLKGPWDGSGRMESYDQVDRYWEHFNYTYIVVFPPSELEIINIATEDLLDREESMWHEASFKAQETLNQDPNNAFAWFNLGASLTNIADMSGADSLYTGAALAFDRARNLGLPWRMLWYQFEPYRAYLGAGRSEEVIALTDAILSSDAGSDVEETHYYRGLALAAQGRQQAAEQAMNRARRLNPNNVLFMDDFQLPETSGD